MKEYIEQAAVNADCIAEVEKIKTPFAYIIVGRSIDKPYYHILWLGPTNGELNIGYSSYHLEYVRQWLADYFEIVEGEDDVVVVPCRCKDCKHWKHFDHLGCTDFVKVCGLSNYMIGATGYCLYGERRNNQ